MYKNKYKVLADLYAVTLAGVIKVIEVGFTKHFGNFMFYWYSLSSKTRGLPISPSARLLAAKPVLYYLFVRKKKVTLNGKSEGFF